MSMCNNYLTCEGELINITRALALAAKESVTLIFFFFPRTCHADQLTFRAQNSPTIITY